MLENYYDKDEFLGIRVDWNTPFDQKRTKGDHPSAVTYYFKDRNSTLCSYTKDGKLLNVRENQKQFFDADAIKLHNID